MSRNGPQWLAPTSLEEALALRTQLGGEATIVAGGTFIGILMNQKIMQPQTLLSLRRVSELAFIETDHDNASSSGALSSHSPGLACACRYFCACGKPSCSQSGHRRRCACRCGLRIG